VHRGEPSRSDRWEDRVWQGHQYNDRTVLKSGSHLRASCPFCHESLIKDGMTHLDTVNAAGDDGWVALSPYLNVFDHRSSVELAEGEQVRDMRCPHCGKSLMVSGVTCERGDSQVACMMVGISTVEVPMGFCMRVGCQWHRIDREDIHKIILDDSPEW
jgi:predicted RNA-binding Zn-ribbon protein involved in translation (DUF1610 family)